MRNHHILALTYVAVSVIVFTDIIYSFCSTKFTKKSLT